MDRPKKTRRLKSWLFAISVSLNILLIGKLVLENFNTPTFQLGKLTKSVNFGFFGKDTTYFVLPKGMTVRNVSPRGIAAIGQFENNRFDIILTTEDETLVDYNISRNKLLPFGNYYSADKAQQIGE